MRPRFVLSAACLAVMVSSLAWSESLVVCRCPGNRQRTARARRGFFKSFPTVTIDVTFETGQGKKSGRYTGVLLWVLLERAQPIDEPGKNTSLKHTLMITGRDGYAVALALGEIDPHYEGKQIIIAYLGGEPSASMSSLRLIVPGDVHGGRSVRDVAKIELR